MTEILEKISSAIVAGDEKRTMELAQEAMAMKMDPFKVIQDGFASGMQVIGDQFARLDCFLPEVMMAADAMTAGMTVIKPHIEKGAARVSQGTIVIATIQGDLHDLGKNIVKVMLEVSGFTVHDLGADVSVRALIDKAEDVGADIIAASAILTTTMAHMPDIAKILTELDLREKYKVMVGGAPVIPQWAREIGADGYGEDATEAVIVAKQLVAKEVDPC